MAATLSSSCPGFLINGKFDAALLLQRLRDFGAIECWKTNTNHLYLLSPKLSAVFSNLPNSEDVDLEQALSQNVELLMYTRLPILGNVVTSGVNFLSGIKASTQSKLHPV